jgi:hypothetical protein
MTDAGRDLERMHGYLVGRLSDEERRMFEDRLTHDPDLVREIEQSLKFSEGLQQLQAQGYFDRRASPPRAIRIWVSVAAAASAAALALILWLQPRVPSSPVLLASLPVYTATAESPAIGAHFTFVALRDGSTPALQMPARGLIEFRTLPSTRTAVSSYRVSLTQQKDGATSKPIGTLSGLPLNGNGYVHFYANVSGLTPGRYQLRLDTEPPASGAPLMFPFTLRPSAVP